MVDPGKEGIYRGNAPRFAAATTLHAHRRDVRTPDDFKKWVEGRRRR